MIFFLNSTTKIPCHLVSAGSGGSYVCELYDRGTVTSLGGLPTEFNYGPTTPDAGACKLDGDHVILIGGHSNKVFVHEVSTNIWVKKKGNC